jgi:hypothetical protein
VIERRWRIGFGAALSVLIALATSPAGADAACSETAARDRLDALLHALHEPKAQKAMAAAKADLQADQDIDNEDDAKYLMAAAVFHQANDHLNAGYADEACAILQKAEKLLDEVIAGR